MAKTDLRTMAAQEAYAKLAPAERAVLAPMVAGLREELRGTAAGEGVCLEIIAALGQLLNHIERQKEKTECTPGK